MNARKMYPDYCARCGVKFGASTMSRFNTDIICMDCEAIEKAHPLYKLAADAELAACKRGDYNYPGIGLPPSLRNRRT